MIKVVIIGSGNVAHHLVSAFSDCANIELIQLFTRHLQNASDLSPTIPVVDNINEIADADIYIIAVSDAAIAEVSGQLPCNDKLVVHTSGTLSIDVLDSRNRKGVFYPLQTFSKNKSVDFTTIPICIESKNDDDNILLEKLAMSISNTVIPISSGQRKSLHIAAVFVSNFTNHLYNIGNDICNANQIPFEILKPLILETASKIITHSPDMAQTGPAMRNDNITVQSHLAALSDKNQRNIYKMLTQSIQTHGKEL